MKIFGGTSNPLKIYVSILTALMGLFFSLNLMLCSSSWNLGSLWENPNGGYLDQIQKFHFHWHVGSQIRPWNYNKLNPADLVAVFTVAHYEYNMKALYYWKGSSSRQNVFLGTENSYIGVCLANLGITLA